MQFGFEPDQAGQSFPQSALPDRRDTRGKEISNVAPIPVKQYLGRDNDSTGTVLDVVALQAALQQQLIAQQQLPSGTLGPADFAVQLVVAPETQKFLLQTSG